MKDTHKLLKEAQLSQGRDRGPRPPRQAEPPARPPAGREPRLPDEDGPAPPDARGPRTSSTGSSRKKNASWPGRERPTSSRPSSPSSRRSGRPSKPFVQAQKDVIRDSQARRGHQGERGRPAKPLATARPPSRRPPPAWPPSRCSPRSNPRTSSWPTPTWATPSPTWARPKLDSAVAPRRRRSTPVPERARPPRASGPAAAEQGRRRVRVPQVRARPAQEPQGHRHPGRRLGPAGRRRRRPPEDLIRAGEPMQAAEGDLAKTAAKPAAADQLAALEAALDPRRRGWPRSLESLLTELRSELADADHRRADRDARGPGGDPRDHRGAGPPGRPEVAGGVHPASPARRRKEGELVEKTDQLTGPDRGDRVRRSPCPRRSGSSPGR